MVVAAPVIMDAVALTQKLVSFNTVNPPGNEAPCAGFIEGLLRELGFDVQRFCFAPGRPSLVALKPGAPGRKPVCFSGHLDTVPLGQQPWRYDPLGGRIVDGRIYGRGTADMKAAIAAMLSAVARFSHDPRRDRGILMILTAGEEKWCQGAYHLASLPKGTLRPVAVLVIGEPTGNRPAIGHKGALWIQIDVTGRSAHGSMPGQGENAIYKAAEIIRRLQSLTFDHPPHALVGRSTLNVGTIRGGQNTNSVPDAAQLTVDIRTVPGQTGQAVIAQITDTIGALGKVQVLTDVPGIASDANDPWIQSIVENACRVVGQDVAVTGVPYFTDAAALVPALGHPPMVILGPGQPGMAHQTDEYCEVGAIAESVEIYYKIVRSAARDSL